MRTNQLRIHASRAGLMAIMLLVGSTTQVFGQSTRPLKVMRLAPASLPYGTKVNPTLFIGIELTPAQSREIAKLADFFFAEDARRDTARHGEPLDSAAKVKMLPILKRQRMAYRAVLTPSQQRIYDKNADTVLALWLQPRSTTKGRSHAQR